MTGTTMTTEAQAAASARRKRLRVYLGRAGVYAILGIFGLMMIFPFVYMAASALKTPADTFTYPPRVLPREPVTETVDGEEQDIFSLDFGDGARDAYITETGIQAGLFVDPNDPETTVAWPLDLAEATGATTTITVDGEAQTADVYRVPLGGATVEFGLQRNTSVAQFAAVDDPTQITYAVARTAPAAEQLTAKWSNFSDVLNLRNLDRALSNTILVTILVVVGQLFTSIMGGYAFARIRFPGRDALFVGYLGSIMIPFVVLIIPLFILMVNLEWNDHLGALVWPFVYTAYGTFLMRQFFVSIPVELEEAAFIDGARRWRILWRIFVPLSWPAIATLATFSFLYAWNSFIWPLVAIGTGNESDQVLTLALRQLGGQSVESPNLIFAGIAMSVVIPLLVFIFAQRYFVENVATSGIK